ncbi:DUF2750 domain-containing protein [Chryseobacterium joostei]|uniref:DUF2750 domain-containing protein n=1 Tax=Chryseobacterium joostei TaxID=112234 RepID=A0A1N7HWB9_9FLAO|nr:DUF2750 domain-containing protein [Chryseobacterium joostei]AZA98891.1 DUF2750 domain-containing protein [Chryseobacterium joostei]SIS29092.1 Protein of unknown function [Chryseobacterium joostei]
MIQDHITIQNRYKDFIKKIIETETVYALKDEKGYATSYSNEIEDEDGEPAQIVCFWSDAARAKSCVDQEWNHYEVFPISLREFIENWCLGMNNDGLIVGTNFDSHLFGYEAEPLEVIIDSIEELRTTGKSLELRKFENMEDLESQFREILKD